MLFPVPAVVPPQDPENHSAVVLVPADPPLKVSVVELPLQIVVAPVILVGAVDSVFTATETVFCIAETAPQASVIMTE